MYIIQCMIACLLACLLHDHVYCMIRKCWKNYTGKIKCWNNKQFVKTANITNLLKQPTNWLSEITDLLVHLVIGNAKVNWYIPTLAKFTIA